MTRPDGDLRATMRDIADATAPVDLYEGSLRRSRRIGRRRALAGTGAALSLLALTGAGLWRLPVLVGPPPTVAASSTPASVPRSRSLADLPGALYYDGLPGTGQLVRLVRGGTPAPVLIARHDAVSVSPDGTRVGYIAADRVWVADVDAGPPRQVYPHPVRADDAPAWLPDGTGLLVTDATAGPGVVALATGRLGAAPAGVTGDHVRFSGDGRRYVASTEPCRLQVVEVGSGVSRTVPGLGAGADNPVTRIGSCRPISVDATGTRVAVSWKPDTRTADLTADAVVDTSTGRLIGLPVHGEVTAALFGPDGNLVIRSTTADRTVLSLVSPANVLLVQADEPAGLHSATLVAYRG